MKYKCWEERLAKSRFKDYIRQYNDKDLYLKVQSEIGSFKGISKYDLNVLEKHLILNMSLEEIAIYLCESSDKVKRHYKTGIKNLKAILFENKKEDFINIIWDEIKKEVDEIKKEVDEMKKEATLRTNRNSARISYLDDTHKKSYLEIYNLVDRETIIKENLISERDLLIAEEVILNGKTLRAVGEMYSISGERVRQIKVRCLCTIKKYNSKLKYK